MSLHVPNQANKEIQLWSAYPFFGDGVEIEGVVDQLLVHPNHIEATLEIGLKSGVLIKAFDPLFCQARALYKTGESYRFSLSALAYSMRLPVLRLCGRLRPSFCENGKWLADSRKSPTRAVGTK
jgi:hypothetical protein